MNELKKGIPAMNRRHVLQALAVMSAGSTTVVALGESTLAVSANTTPGDLSAALRNSRQLCIDLLSRLDRVQSRSGLVVQLNATAIKAATETLQELEVLLDRAEARVSAGEQRAVALLQACADSLMRVEMPLESLCHSGALPRPVFESSVAIFETARQLLYSPSVA
jgi:hypothetical protein